MIEINSHEILKFLPHRYPFLLVDKVIELIPNESILALKNVTRNEEFFQGHFPTQAVMPGVLIVEALAQAAAILAYRTLEISTEEALFYLGAIENARFKKVVLPGDQLRLKMVIEKRRFRVWKFKGIATVDDEIVCTLDMTSSEGRVVS